MKENPIIKRESILERSREIVRRMMEKEEIKQPLRAIEICNEEAHKHSLRVAVLSAAIGYSNGLTEKEIECLAKGGLLHDIGKIGLPYDILCKKEKTTEEEQELISNHSRIGFDKLQHPVYEGIRNCCFHHEFKKNAYPRKCPRSKDKIAEIICAADIYDALSQKRSYKEAFPKSKVEEIMRDEFKGNAKYIDQIFDIS